MPEKHLDGFWIYELDQEVKINSLTLIDSREGKAQRMSVTNSYFHDGLNCGINLRGAHEVLIANSHSERTRTGGVVAMEDFWWGEGGFPGMLPSLLRTAAFRYLRHCTRALDQLLQWRAAGAVRQLLKRLPPFMEHMQRLEMHTCIHAALSHTPAHGSSHKERTAQRHYRTLSPCMLLPDMHAAGLSQAVTPLQAMWCCGTIQCTTHTTRKTRVPQSVHLPLGWMTTPQVHLCSPSAPLLEHAAPDGQGIDASRVILLPSVCLGPSTKCLHE